MRRWKWWQLSLMMIPRMHSWIYFYFSNELNAVPCSKPLMSLLWILIFGAATSIFGYELLFDKIWQTVMLGNSKGKKIRGRYGLLTRKGLGSKIVYNLLKEPSIYACYSPPFFLLFIFSFIYIHPLFLSQKHEIKNFGNLSRRAS